MTVTTGSFRGDFPAFANTAAYPDTAVAFWLGIAALQLDPDRWAEMLDVGTELFVAHNLTLEGDANRSAAVGASPGQGVGVLSAKAIDKVSASYDVASAMLEDGGAYNKTTYGIRFLTLARMFGSGGLQF